MATTYLKINKSPKNQWEHTKVQCHDGRYLGKYLADICRKEMEENI